MTAGTGEIKSLTALRGIAAMAVVIEHFSATAEHHAAVPVPSLVAHGYLAVDLFFVLSGFIMAYTYLSAFEADGLRAYPGFLGKRIARIVPLNTAVLACLIGAGWLSSHLIGRNLLFQSDNLPFDLLTNLLMLQGIGIGTNLNGPSWTISTEFAAYIIFPLLILSLACNTGRAARWLSSPVPYFLGVISYSIYLIHSPFRPVELELVRWLHPAPLSLPQALGFALAGSVSIIPVAWLAYRWVERPGRSLVRRLLAGG